MTKSVSYDGVAAATADEVADALLEFALVVARCSAHESVTIPVLVAGRLEQLTVLLGPTIRLSSLTGPTDDTVEIAGAAETAEELRRRTAVFTDPFFGYRPGQVA